MKHCSILSYRIFFMTLTHGIWEFYIKINSNQSWNESKSTVPFYMHLIHMTSPKSLLAFMCITNTSNTLGWIGAVDLIRSHIIPSDIKTTIQFPTHTSTFILHIHKYILSNRMFRRFPTFVKKSLPVLSRVSWWFFTLLTIIFCPYCHTHEDRRVLWYPNQYA